MAAGNPVTYPHLEVVPPVEGAPSRWCLSSGKRTFDFALASILLLLLLPLIAVIALLVKLTSSGPVLFRHTRCGQNNSRFSVLKFRTMVRNGSGPNLTRAGDARVTSVGRILRKSKLDELPQLINVIRGDMSLVGPRPDVPEYFELSKPEVVAVLKLRPGVTGWASITFRHEEELLAQAPPHHLQEFYVRQVLPKKARLDLAYASRATFASDLGILLRTVSAVLPRIRKRSGSGRTA